MSDILGQIIFFCKRVGSHITFEFLDKQAHKLYRLTQRCKECLLFTELVVINDCRARWRDNRTIFNTPNPRLMNVSLLQHNKNTSEQRRGSRGSVRAPSRQPSMASLRPTSPNASQGTTLLLFYQHQIYGWFDILQRIISIYFKSSPLKLKA